MPHSVFDCALPNGRITREVRPGILDGMTDANVFTPPTDEGQAGWVLLPDGRRAYRYNGSDDLIIHKEAAVE